MDKNKLYDEFDWQFNNFLTDRVFGKTTPSQNLLELCELVLKTRMDKLGKNEPFDFLVKKQDVCTYRLMIDVIDGLVGETPLDSTWEELNYVNTGYVWYLTNMVDERIMQFSQNIDRYHSEYTQSMRENKIDELLNG
jgi:hypothetical protein